MKLIMKYLKPYYGRMLFGLFVKICGTVAELFMPWILAHIIDNVIPETKLSGNMNHMIFWSLMMLLMAVLARTFNVFANRKAAEVSKNTIFVLRNDLFQKILHLSGKQTDKVGIPSLISRMTTDTYNIHHAINMMQRMGVRAPMIILGGLVITATLDPVLTLVLAGTMPFIVAVIVIISKKGIPLYGKVQQAIDVMVRTLREDVVGIRVIKALSKKEYEKKRFEEANAEVCDKELLASGVMAASSPLINFFLNMGLTLVVIVGAYRVNAGLTQAGKIVAFLTYFTMISNAVIAINRIFVMFSKALASSERVEAVLNAEDNLQVEQLLGSANNNRLEFRNVSFSYQDDMEKLCLEHVNFTLKPGENLGIIGATGSGKTTLLNLLMRFYDVTEGEIFIDGKNIKTYPLQELRRKFGVAFQNDVVFHDTVRENISFGRDLTEEKIVEAAKQANAYEFIMDKEGGLDHVAAIKGADFSGGQKQRMLVARALAGDNEFLLLDDASSALDYKTDAYIRKQIREQKTGVTTVTVAQRISSVMQSDLILVLDDGTVIGQGTHEELMADCETYREIYKSQMGLDLKTEGK
ncbi:MAG: ABC transporter ATP-binding protein [Lachnospiraceae bacterium]|nr:ABC transporter ATP-binding protein [Lachnospiraceae bacterium]